MSKLGEIDAAFLACCSPGMYVAGHFGDRLDLRLFLTCGMIRSVPLSSRSWLLILRMLGSPVQTTPVRVRSLSKSDLMKKLGQRKGTHISKISGCTLLPHPCMVQVAGEALGSLKLVRFPEQLRLQCVSSSQSSWNAPSSFGSPFT